MVMPPRSKFIVVPALNENGESNFNYAYGVGFDTKYFEDMAANLDEASFKALYMNEPMPRSLCIMTVWRVPQPWQQWFGIRKPRD